MAEQSDQPDQVAHSAAVQYVVQLLPSCKNPHELAKMIFGRVPQEYANTENYQDIQHKIQRTRFHTQDLGDGTIAYIFDLPGGAGQFAEAPNKHFISKNGVLPFFHGVGLQTCYRIEGAKINRKYQIDQDDLVEWSQDMIRIRHSRWFWHHDRYIEAYADITDFHGTSTREWNLSAQLSYGIPDKALTTL